MVFPISGPIFGDFFVGNPNNSLFYDMLKFATNACISAPGVNKKYKTKGKQYPGRLNIVLGLQCS